MAIRDLTLSIVASFLFVLFLTPTLINTGYINKLPVPFYPLFVAIPVLAAIGMTVASLIGKKILLIWQFAKFMLVGFLNTAIDFGILNLLIFLTNITSGLQIIPLNAASFLIAIVNSYFWNRKWVFEGSKKGNFLTFLAVTLIGLAINSGIVFAITTYVPPVIVSSPTLWANIAKALATGVSLFWNFAGYKLIVFKK